METAHRRPCQSIMKPQALQCVDCGFITNYPNALQMHRLKEHAKGPEPNKPFKCGVCSYQTSFRSNLQKHQRVHTGEKPYTCVCCSMKFSFRSNHKRHEQRCLAARGVRCPHPPCSYIAEHQGALTAHLERHHHFHGSPSSSAVPGRAPTASACRSSAAVTSTAAISLDHNLTMNLNPFTSAQDPTQSAMLDLYYKTFTDAAHSLAFSSETQLNNLHAETFASYNCSTPMRCEPDESSEHNFRRSSSCSRKQPNPRRTSSDLYPGYLDPHEPEEDIKPDIEKLGSQLRLPTQGQTDLRYGGHQRELADSRDDTITSTVCKLPSRGPSARYPSGDMDVDDVRKAGTSLAADSRRNQRSDSSQLQHGPPAAEDELVESDPAERRSAGSSCTSATPSSLAEAEPSGGGMLELPAGGALSADMRVDGLLQILVEGGRLHRCQHCRILFEDYATYVLHMGCHGATNPFSCHFCSRVFQEKYGFLAHFMKCIGN